MNSPGPLLATLALLLGGCATPVPAPPPPPVPAAWHADPMVGAEDLSEPRWSLLADPTLQALLERAEAANRDLAQAALRIAQARTQAGLGELRLTPAASVSAGNSRALDPPGGLPAFTTRSYGASASVGYEADLWGRLAATRAADRAQLAAAESDLRAARLLMRQQVSDSYWQLAGARLQGELAREQLALNRELLAATQLRVREGQVLPIETDRAAATLQQAEVRLADLQADAALQRLQLALLLDLPPPGPEVPQPALPGDLPPRWRPGASPATVLERRPDVHRARATVDAALARAQVAEAQRYPQLSFSAGLSTGGGTAGDWLRNPVASLAANLVVPMVDWRRLDLQRDAARTELELAALALRDTVARALVEVETALVEGERLRRQLEANATRLRETTEAERVAKLRLDAGAIARADWLQARNARLEAEQSRLQLRLRAWLNRSQLVRALAVPGPSGQG